MLTTPVMGIAQVSARPARELIVTAVGRSTIGNEKGQIFGTRYISNSSIEIDSIRSRARVRHVFAEGFRVVVDSAGHVVRMDIVPGPARPGANFDLDARLDEVRGFISDDAHVSFDAVRAASVLRALPASLPTHGRIAAPFDWRAEYLGVVEAERGTRITTFLRDTVVSGMTNWWVRDSAQLTRHEEWPSVTYTMDSVMHARTSEGYEVSTFLYDPARAIVRQRVDTVRLTSVLTRQLSRGGVYQARHRVVLRRFASAETPTEYELALEEIRKKWENRTGGMVMVPRDSTSARVERGDRAVYDSLMAAWRSHTDRDERLSIEGMMEWRDRSARSVDWRIAMAEYALANADTATALRVIMPALGPYVRHIPEQALRIALPLLERPDVALRYGLSAEDGFLGISQMLESWPPAVYGDSAACSPAGCALIEQYLQRNDVDPRLHELAVITRFLRKPADHFELLAGEAAKGGILLESVYRMALGFGRESALPAPGADHGEWLAWNGLSTGTPVLELYVIRTGRDLLNEFRALFRTAPSDSAKLAFGRLALEVSDEAFTHDEAKQLALSNSAPLKSLAANIVARHLRPARMADSIASFVLEATIANQFACGPVPWDSIRDRPDCTPRNEDSDVIISDSLPRSIVERWRGRLPFRTTDQWNSRDVRLVGSATRYSVKTYGDFVEIVWTASSTLDRAPDAPSYHYASGGSVVVLRTASAWIEVDFEFWIT